MDKTKIEISNNELLKENIKEYKKTIDILVILNDTIFIDIEINRSNFERVKLRNTIEGELYLPEEVVFSYHSKLIEPSFEEDFVFIKKIKDGKVIEVQTNEKKYID